MGRAIRLTESELVGLVRKAINENEQEKLVNKLMTNSSVRKVFDKAVSKLSDEQIQGIKNRLEKFGITPDSSFSEIKNVVDDVEEKIDVPSEMTEEDDNKLSFPQYAKLILGMMGVGNTILLGAPFAALYNALTGSEYTDKIMDWSGIVGFGLMLFLAELFEKEKPKSSNMNEEDDVETLVEQPKRKEDSAIIPDINTIMDLGYRFMMARNPDGPKNKAGFEAALEDLKWVFKSTINNIEGQRRKNQD